ncbi:hypothetical protein V8E36_006087 [Tilletia maclaganii]
MSFYSSYSGTPAGSAPGTPGNAASQPAAPVRRPVGRPRKTAPAGQPTAGQGAQHAVSFNTPQPSRTAQNAQAGSSQQRAAAASSAPVGLAANPYASPAYSSHLRAAGPPKDGSETQFYLIPGPTNRMLLSVRSAVPSQIDWALGKLVQSSFAFADGLQFEQLPNLYDQLLTFPHRVARAWSGAPESEWAQSFFEVDEPPEMYSPAEGHIEHDDETVDYFEETGASGASSSTAKFRPAQVSSHASLLRRALESGLVLRNLSMMPLNTKWLTQPTPQARARVDATIRVVSEVLRIARPIGNVPSGTDASGKRLDKQMSARTDDSFILATSSTLELEGLAELKAYMLDLFEVVAPFALLEQGAPPDFGVVLSTRERRTGAAAAAALAAQDRRREKLREYNDTAKQPPAKKDASAKDQDGAIVPADSIFHSLLGIAHHSKDRNLLVASLRCLAALAGYTMRNRSIGFTEREWEVVEVDTEAGGADGNGEPAVYVTKVHSPGLLHLSALYVPLLHLRRTDPHAALRIMGTSLGHTPLANLPSNGIAPSVKLEGDTDLGEAALDLLTQLVQIEGNALRIGLSGVSPATEAASAADAEQPAAATPSSSTATASKDTAGSPLSPASLSSFLTLLLPFQRVAWLRSSLLTWNPSILPHDLPSWQRHQTAQKVQREQKKRIQRRMLGYREDEESLEERSMRKRLRVWEAVELEGLAEPERSIKWMKLVFARAPDAELTQMEFWQSYQEEFRGVPDLLSAADLIKLIAQIFPGASAMVVKPAPNAPQRFIIKGIDIRQRDHYGPLECRWAGCNHPHQVSGRALAAHLRAHVDAYPANRLRCRWGGGHSCAFVPPEYSASADAPGAARRSLTEAEQRDSLFRHLLTHVQQNGLRSMGVNGADYADTASSNEQAGDGPRPKRIRLDASQQGPVRSGTIGRPGSLYYTVARTPMDPLMSAPIGASALSAQILRTLARVASRVLDRAGQRPELPSSLDLVPEGGGSLLDVADAAATQDARMKALAGLLGSAAAAGPNGAEADDGKFGFPMPSQDDASKNALVPLLKTAATAPEGAEDATPKAEEKFVAAHNHLIRDIFGITIADGDGALIAGTSLGTSSNASDEEAAIRAANAIMDGLLSVEGAMLAVSGENDVLCPALNETLVELRPVGARSVFLEL